jgi:hypothetical protein
MSGFISARPETPHLLLCTMDSYALLFAFLFFFGFIWFWLAPNPHEENFVPQPLFDLNDVVIY